MRRSVVRIAHAAFIGGVATLGATSATAQEFVYRVIDLGARPDFPSRSTQAINEAGQIVGYDVHTNGRLLRAFVWDNDGWTDFGDGEDSRAFDINDLGQIVGDSDYTAALWENGAETLLADPRPFWSQAWSINNHGLIVGHHRVDALNDYDRAAIFDVQGGVQLLNVLGNNYDSYVYASNNGGSFVGKAEVNFQGQSIGIGLLNGTPRMLPPLGASECAVAVAVNEQNVSCGFTTYGACWPSRAAMWDEMGVGRILSAIGASSGAKDLNDHLEVVGWATRTGGATVATLWRNGVVFELTELLADGETPPPLEVATGVNNAGLISVDEATGGASLLVPEPSPRLSLDSIDPARAGTANTIVVRNATPGAIVYLGLGTTEGATSIPGCPGLFAGVDPVRLTLRAVADSNGAASFSFVVPSFMSDATGIAQAIEPGSCRVSPVGHIYFE